MQHAPVFTRLLTLSVCLLFLSCTTHAHNITHILAKYPEFSTFSHYLTVTHLAGEINRRQTITVLAVSNAGMADLLSKHLSVYVIKNVLSLHVLVDYFGARKLHQITDGTASSATLFQSTGSAPGTAGFVNITDLKHGKVGFGAQDSGHLNAYFVKSVVEIPYNISVLEISQILTSAVAEAPAEAPSLNLTIMLSKQGCKAFGDLLEASGAIKTFEENADGGLTVFCPSDDVIKGFMPKYKNLTAAGKVSLLLYHGIPIYQSMQMLKSSNGLTNTLATDGAKKYDFTVQTEGEDITLETKVVTARVTGTVLDQEPVVLYKINKVLLPRELFKGTVEDDEAESPKAASPKSSKKSKDDTADSPDADSPESDDSEDSTADQDDENSGGRFDGGRWASVLLTVFAGAFVLF
ncbi:Fasciclin-like arabinogalactan protein 2 [Vitis vinifera]|uniref:Fasciclin-like arabinogalactan protein 2 n=1 Tax=Vitis vinifera TaxID=29760 RepID=A0A438DQ95_VITVI|nr:Fasciclin-like arabinogalactan protein 2 [Vitis vinifera]